jgi:hypothetical protein
MRVSGRCGPSGRVIQIGGFFGSILALTCTVATLVTATPMWLKSTPIVMCCLEPLHRWMLGMSCQILKLPALYSVGDAGPNVRGRRMSLSERSPVYEVG